MGGGMRVTNWGEMPVIHSMMDVIIEDDLNYIWGEAGHSRDRLIARIIRDFNQKLRFPPIEPGWAMSVTPKEPAWAVAAIPKNAPTALFQANINVVTQRVDFSFWSDVQHWVDSVDPGLIIVPVPEHDSHYSTPTHLLVMREHLIRDRKTLIVVSDLPESHQREFEKNPTAPLDFGIAAQGPGCILHHNEVAWPGAINVLQMKGRSAFKGLCKFAEGDR